MIPKAASAELFPFGFLVCAANAAPRSGGAYWPSAKTRWTRTDLGGFLLWTDPLAGLLKHASDEGQAVVIGDAFSTAGRSVAEVADELLRTEDWASIADLGGRFTILLITQDRCRIAHDPFGSRSVFYRLGDAFAAASHAVLLGDAYGHARDAAVVDFMDLPAYRSRTVRYLPGDVTVYAGIHALVPNNAYDSRDGRSHRYWPAKPRRGCDIVEFMSALDRYFDAFVPFVAERYDPVIFGITGGVDSRAVCAAFLAKGVPIEGMTWKNGYLHSAERPTVDRIVMDLGMPHQYVDVKPDTELAIATAAGINGGGSRGRSRLTAAVSGTISAPGGVFLSGHGGEILRGFYQLTTRKRNARAGGMAVARRRLAGFLRAIRLLPAQEREGAASPRTLTRLYSRSAKGGTADPVYKTACESFFRDFIRRANYKGVEKFGFDLHDIFYWEHRMGMWGAAKLNEMDTALYSMAGLNGREIYEIAFGLPDNRRLTKALLKQAAARYHEKLGTIPYA
jgi:hypothetical protein